MEGSGTGSTLPGAFPEPRGAGGRGGGPGGRIAACAAGRAMIEEIHWGLTPVERELVWYDTSWIWGPPEDDFAHLVRTIRAGRLVYGTGWPLRLSQVTRANLSLLPPELGTPMLADPTRWT